MLSLCFFTGVFPHRLLLQRTFTGECHLKLVYVFTFFYFNDMYKYVCNDTDFLHGSTDPDPSSGNWKLFKNIVIDFIELPLCQG